ncbi:DUF4351 domain-containing protein, partial [Myxococcota bacterium]
RVEGRVEGRVEERVALVKRILAKRLGELPEWAEARIDTAKMEQLDAWVDQLATASSLSLVDILGPA